MNDPYQNTTQDVPNLMATGRSQTLELQLNTDGQLALISAKGWIRFIGVLGFILFGFFTFGLIGILYTSIQYGGMVGGGFISLLLIIMDVVILLFSIRLSKYASAINRVKLSRQPIDFEIAMHAQMKFWSLFGILAILWTVFIIISLLTIYI